MSDLISRRALLEKFNDTSVQITFDLPVEEMLGEDVDIDDFTMLVTDAIQAYKKMVIGVIKEQPIAFDKEEVVWQLETCDPQEMMSEEQRNVLNYAIEIVKAGGIDGI